MRLSFHNRGAPHAYIVYQPTRGERNEQSEHSREALTNDEREMTGPDFLEIPREFSFM